MLFLLGVTQRSGTTYLNDLLLCHPDIAARPPLWEDYLLEKIGPLVDFAVDVVTGWQEEWDLDDQDAERFFGLLGGALEQFFIDDPECRYVLARTPSPTNVYATRLLFRRSPVVFVVRDGRAVCESAHRSFGTDVRDMAEVWIRNGREILDFVAARRTDDPPCLVLRYEDLVNQPDLTVLPLLEHLGLDPSRYDVDAARNLPVRGSSVWRGGAPFVHWDPVPKGADFRPIEHYQDCDAETRRSFEQLGRDMLEAFGYETDA